MKQKAGDRSTSGVARVCALAGAAVVCAVGALVPSVASAATTGSPYQDPSAVGYLGFCNQQGQQVTSGSVATAPFAWRAISSRPAQAPYGHPGRTATLYAYQPRQDVPSGEWSGEQLTASSRYTDPEHPMAAATGGDESLQDFLADFPANWDGFVQVRLYLGVPGHPVYSLSYAATDIQVTGSTWHVVGGGPVSCSGSGSSESIEALLLPKSATRGASSSTAAHPAKGTSPAPAPSTGGASSASPGAAASGSGGGSTPPGASASVASTSSASGHSRGALVTVAVAVALLAALAVVFFLFVRRRGALSAGGVATSSTPRTSQKGL